MKNTDTIKMERLLSQTTGRIRERLVFHKKYRPYAVAQTKTTYRDGSVQLDRTLYDKDGIIIKQIHSGDHHRPDKHPYGENGEHAHSYQWDSEEKLVDRSPRELTEEERIQHIDIIGGTDG